MRLEMELACDPEFIRWTSDSVRSVLPQIERLRIAHDAIGDLETLEERLQIEVARSKAVVPWIGLVGAWTRRD